MIAERACQLVRLVKTDDVLGPAGVGEQFEVLDDRDLPRPMAVRRAFEVLVRERPAENPGCWTVDGGE